MENTFFKFSWPYFVGLFEGNGHITISNNVATFCITVHEKNGPLLVYIKAYFESLGYDISPIRIKAEDHAHVLTIRNKRTLHFLAINMKDLFKTPKIVQMYNLIDWLNQNYFEKPISYDRNFIPNIFDLNDAWLSGFIDADGNFMIGLVFTPTTMQTKTRFTLDQRMADKYGNSYRGKPYKNF